MEIEIEKKKFSEMLEAVALKGKYYNGDSAKNGMLSNYAYVTFNGDNLLVFNADTVTACAIKHRVEEVPMEGHVVLEIDRTVKYLKGFSGKVRVTVGDYVAITGEDERTKANLPKVINHPNQSMIEFFRNFLSVNAQTFADGGLPSLSKTADVRFAKSFETKVTVLADDLLKATKGCDALNLARYKFDVNQQAFSMSSDRGIADKYHTYIETIDIEGEPSTVEFTGHFAQFLNGPVELYLRDDFPLFWKTPTRMLLKAPYLNR
jgi:hypothetical protein